MKPSRALLIAGLAGGLAGSSCSDDSSPLNVVPSAPAHAAGVRGADQTARVATALPEPIVVEVLDQYGNPVPGVEVEFATTDGGSVSAAIVVTDANGEARTDWTLGTIAGPNVLTATVVGAGAGSATFTATATPGPPARVLTTTGDDQSAEVASVLPGELVATVTDRYDNPVPDVAVSWVVSSGGGTVEALSPVTDAQGQVRARWRLGTQAGTATATAVAVGTAAGVSAQFTATAYPGPAANIDKVAGDRQQLAAGGALPDSLVVVVSDVYGNRVPGVSVSWMVASGDGVVSPPRSATSAAGVARTRWTLGHRAGQQAVRASVDGLPEAEVTFLATALSVPDDAFDVEVRWVGPTPTTPHRQAVDRAVARWQSVLVGDLSDIPFNNIDIGACASGRTLNETVDDVLIFVEITDIDGPGRVLGSAGPCYIRVSNFLPIVGSVHLDAADLAVMEQNGTLDDVILHEIGHVLGIGSLWTTMNLLAGAGGSDPFFTGADARIAFDAAGGVTYDGNKVPVENLGGRGTRDGHWRESVMGPELMTGFISGPGNPLSAITVASLRDMGYVVNMDAADGYLIGDNLRAHRTEPVVPLHELPWTGPIQFIDERGRIAPSVVR
jgi:hypothetical protein